MSTKFNKNIKDELRSTLNGKRWVNMQKLSSLLQLRGGKQPGGQPDSTSLLNFKWLCVSEDRCKANFEHKPPKLKTTMLTSL